MDQSILLQKFIGVVILGVATQWVAWRLAIPAIILLFFAGMLAGPILHLVNPARDFGDLVQVLIKIAVALILFEGGINLRLHELKTSGRGVRQLVGLGLPLAWIFGTLAAHYVGGFSTPVSLLLSAIVVVTGPTVIMPLIRQTTLSSRVNSLLKWEGIINDPLGVLLAVMVFEYFSFWESNLSVSEIAIRLTLSLVMAVILGMGGGHFLKFAFQRERIPDFLKLPVILSMVLLIYGLGNLILDEIGLLSVTIFGLTVGNIGLLIIHDLRRFKEHITLLLVSTVFILLTASLQPDQLLTLNARCVAFLFCLLFLVRPAAVWLSTLGAGLSFNERLFVGWIAPRGVVAASVSGLFGPQLVQLGYADGEILGPMVFLIIFTTVLAHGFSFSWLATRLGLASKIKNGLMIVGASSWSIELAKVLKDAGLRVLMIDNSWHNLKQARFQSIPFHFGEILSETSEQNLDLAEIGYLLAATENDAYNALVCNSFVHHFGRERVYQLALHKKREEVEKEVKTASRGKTAFGEHWLYETLLVEHYHGGHFHKTRLTEEFKFENYMVQNEKSSGIFLIISQKGEIILNSQELKEPPPPRGYYYQSGVSRLTQS